jgi:multidrug efflux pump subunit AcrA (membrane-fusion protein)
MTSTSSHRALNRNRKPSMKSDHCSKLAAAALAVACLSLASCRKIPEEEAPEQTAATVVHQEEKNPDQPTVITLTEDAQKRVDVHTAPVETAEIAGKQQTAMPFAALLYSPDGATWTFINDKPLSYTRQRIEVGPIVGDKVVITKGLAVGTQVVTIGSSLLYGAEHEFEEE